MYLHLAIYFLNHKYVMKSIISLTIISINSVLQFNEKPIVPIFLLCSFCDDNKGTKHLLYVYTQLDEIFYMYIYCVYSIVFCVGHSFLLYVKIKTPLLLMPTYTNVWTNVLVVYLSNFTATQRCDCEQTALGLTDRLLLKQGLAGGGYIVC